MDPNLIRLLIEETWTLASFVAIALSIFAIPKARRVRADTAEDVEAMERASEKNGRLSFAYQQLKEGRYLLWAHYLALAHQIMFFLVGIKAVLEPNEYIPPDAPILKTFLELFGLLAGQLLILVLQFCLVAVTFEQERWRKESLTRSADEDGLGELAHDTNERVREIQERGRADKPAEDADRQEGREHRGLG